MPMLEERDLQQPMQLGQMELLQNKPSAASTLLSDAYDWTMDHKLAVGAVVGLAVLGAGASRLVSQSRAAMAEFYGAPGVNTVESGASRIGLKAPGESGLVAKTPTGDLLPAVSIENSVLKKPGLTVDNSDAAMGSRALNAKLHEIPTFHEMPWDKLIGKK